MLYIQQRVVHPAAPEKAACDLLRKKMPEKAACDLLARNQDSPTPKQIEVELQTVIGISPAKALDAIESLNRRYHGLDFQSSLHEGGLQHYY